MRAGKVAGSDLSDPRCDFKRRNATHFHAAKTTHLDSETSSEFYTCYPSITNPNHSNVLRSGFFEDLQQYAALSFNRTENTDGLTKTNEEGLFVWSEDAIKKTDAMNVGSCKTLRERQLVLIAYLFEIAYDLCVSLINNVSQNLGFESCLGICHNR